jgi:hypothetical protein
MPSREELLAKTAKEDGIQCNTIAQLRTRNCLNDPSFGPGTTNKIRVAQYAVRVFVGRTKYTVFER